MRFSQQTDAKEADRPSKKLIEIVCSCDISLYSVMKELLFDLEQH